MLVFRIFFSGKRKEEMEKIQKMFKKAKQQGDDKATVAQNFLHPHSSYFVTKKLGTLVSAE
jgi:hypothetical protein